MKEIDEKITEFFKCIIYEDDDKLKYITYLDLDGNVIVPIQRYYED